MRRTVVAVFGEAQAAQRAAQALRDSGFAQERVQVSDEDHAPDEGAEGLAAYLRSFFAEVFGPHEEHHVGRYAEALGRGHAVVRVTVDGEGELDSARQALQAAGAIDVEQRP
jgi:hypothetical protein